MMASLRSQYNLTGRIDRKNLLQQHGIYLLKEAILDNNHTMMKYRTNASVCNVAIEGMPSGDVNVGGDVNFKHDEDSIIYGFSRVIRGRSNGVYCSEKPFVYN